LSAGTLDIRMAPLYLAVVVGCPHQDGDGRRFVSLVAALPAEQCLYRRESRGPSSRYHRRSVLCVAASASRWIRSANHPEI